jgi:hypothetical protein
LNGGVIDYDVPLGARWQLKLAQWTQQLIMQFICLIFFHAVWMLHIAHLVQFQLCSKLFRFLIAGPCMTLCSD